jgi:hypothetical protein
VVLSHAWPGDLDRCLAVSLGAARVHLCARCTGLYPALALGLAARLAGLPWLEASPRAELALRLVLPVLGGAAWGLEQAGLALPRAARVASGVALGAGIGWVLGLHLRAPWPGELVELSAALGAILVVGLLARSLRGGPVALDLGPPPGPGPGSDGKKTPLREKNEVDPKAG